MSQETKKEGLSPKTPKNISRRSFLILTAVTVAGTVGTELALNRGRFWREIGEFLFSKETDERWRIAEEVIKATSFSSKESFQNTVIAINQLNRKFGVEETIPFNDFEEENNWLRIKRERIPEHWLKFWNVGPVPLGLVLPFLGSFSEKEKEKREVFSNTPLFLPWIFCSLELIQNFGGEERFRKKLGISEEKLIIDPKNKRGIIDCSEGIFNTKVGDTYYRFFPYCVMGILEGEFSDKNLSVISLPNYLDWLKKFLTLPLPPQIKEDLNEVSEILRRMGKKSLSPLNLEGLFLDNWRVFGEEKRPSSPELFLASSQQGNFPKFPQIEAPSVVVRFGSDFKEWQGPFKERISPFQIGKVDWDFFKERKENGLLIRHPKVLALPYTLGKLFTTVGAWLPVSFGKKV
ncbi:MAG: hypothetical protein ACPLKP_00020 [Microgenomates group bacterium]